MHFAVLVIGADVGRQLALYGRGTRVAPYRRYVTEEEIDDERQFLQAVGDTRLPVPSADEGALPPVDGDTRLPVPSAVEGALPPVDGDTELSVPSADEGALPPVDGDTRLPVPSGVEGALPPVDGDTRLPVPSGVEGALPPVDGDTELGGDTELLVRAFAGEDLSPVDEIGHDERGWYFWSTENWLSRWDYWGLDDGYSLLTKPGGGVVRPDQVGFEWPDILDRPGAWQRAVPGQRLRGVQSTVGEVDFAAMAREATEAAEEAWERYDVARRTGQADELQLRQIAGFTREQFLLRHTWHPAHLVEGGRLHERGDLGLRADVSDARAAQWSTFVDELVAMLPATTLLTIVNCHS